MITSDELSASIGLQPGFLNGRRDPGGGRGKIWLPLQEAMLVQHLFGVARRNTIVVIRNENDDAFISESQRRKLTHVHRVRLSTQLHLIGCHPPDVRKGLYLV
jgi:hypothetical protein